jgi:hypothetical protein
MPGTVRWYTFAAQREIKHKKHISAVVLEPIRRPPQEFFPHAFVLSEKRLVQVGRAPLEDAVGKDLHVTGRGGAAPDLADAARAEDATLWFEFKDEAIHPDCRGGKTDENLLQQVDRYRAHKAWGRAAPHVVGLTIRESWKPRTIGFHAIQPMVLPGGRAALRVLWNVGERTRQDRVTRYPDLRWKTLFDGLYRDLLTARPRLQGYKQRYHGKDHRRIRVFKARGVQLSFRLWPDTAGQLGVLVAWRANDNNPGARKIISSRPWTARVLPLGEAQEGVETVLRDRNSAPWWEGTPLFDALTACCDEFIEGVQIR